MIGIQSYNFSTIENPLSDGGNFKGVSDTNFTGALKVIAGNLCEPTASGTPSGPLWVGDVSQGGGTWPADQYSEVTLTTITASASDVFYLMVRQGAFNSGTQYLINLQGAGSGQTSVLFAIVSGTVHTLATHAGLTIAQGDIWRLAITGNVITVFRNASQVYTFTDTNNFISSGSPAFGLNAVTAIGNAQTNLWTGGANQAASPSYNPSAGPYTGQQTVTLSSVTPGGTIFYTLDGTTPTHSSASIANGGTVAVNKSLTLQSFISVTDFADSTIQSQGYVITVSTTTFSPVAGAYGPAQTVTFNNTDSNLSGFAMYYTTDGSTPTTGSTLYSSPITVSTTETVKVLAVATGCTNSAIASAAYTINGAVTTTTFSPVAGAYGPAQTVTFNNADSALPGFAMYYTTDGSTPTTGSTLYSGPITVNVTETVKVLAVATNYSNSAIASAVYTINGAVTASTFNPAAGSYTSTQSVTLSNADSALPGFAQYYTTDGSTPTTGSTLYTVPITVSATQTIKVLAVATNYSNSSIAVAAYTISSSGAAWSPVDSRVNKPNNATFRTVNGAQIDDVQTSSNPAVPGTDSRVNKPVPCGTYPQNSRTPPPFKS